MLYPRALHWNGHDWRNSATLVSTIEEMLSGHNLSIINIRGQGYDGVRLFSS